MRLVFDIEANGLYNTATTIWCVCAKDIDTCKKYEWHVNQGVDLLEFLTTTLTNAEELIGHNIINYDLPLIKKLIGWKPNEENCRIIDTLVMSRLANPDRSKPEGYTGKSGSHGLEAWGYRVGQGKLSHEEWDVFSTDMLRRCRQDVEINCIVYSAVSDELKDFSEESINLEHNIAKIITEQEHHGIRFDKDRAEDYAKFLTEKINEIDKEIVPQLPKELKVIGNSILEPFLKTGGYKKQVREYIENELCRNSRNTQLSEGYTKVIGGPFTRIKFDEFDLGSVQKVKSYLLDNGWQPEYWNTSKTTGERTSPKLEGEFLGVDGEIPRRVRDRITYRHRRSQIEGWIRDAIPNTGLRLDSENYTVYDYYKLAAGANPLGAPTGRMYHSTVVNIPKAETNKETGELNWDIGTQKVFFGTQMRSLFIPREGFVIVGHDLSGIELRMLAHYMDDEEFTKELLTGDIHTFNQMKAGLETRAQAKTFIYALIYGAGDGKIGSIVGGDANDGRYIKNEYFAAMPKLETFINRVKRASGKGWVKGLDGRKLICRKEKDGKINRRSAPNLLLQGGATIVHKKASEILWNNVEIQKLSAFKILDMHDEQQSEVRNLSKYIEPYCELAVNSVIESGKYFNLNIPLAAEVKIGMNMAETH